MQERSIRNFGEIDKVLAGRDGLTAEELDFILNDGIRLRQGFGGQVKYRLGRDAENEEE